MSYRSKRSIAYIVGVVALVAAYVVVALGRSGTGADLRSWATLMLIFAGLWVVVLVVVQMVFHVGLAVGVAATEAREDTSQVERIMRASMADDEQNSLIELRAGRVDAIVVGLGLVVALAAMALGASAVAGLHVQLAAVAVGSLAENVWTIVAHEGGGARG
ncbi:hypothetical protein ACPYO6_16470 [Georgenia sp. Z1344]|uniref:hypothetical protein n=1 Tax=Georgenia sp. Z1344 TaxID=3416706 RepID=UPI003CEC61F1